ncbi:MAG: hypothetical protein ACR2QF_16735 [Geminicoccaceae bacterium]
MLNESNLSVSVGDSVIITFFLDLSAWAADPAVLTAIASLLTALAAFFRARHRRAVDPLPPTQTEQLAPPLSRAYETLHAVEERIREELLLQLQNLQEEAERIGQDLEAYQQANAALKETIARCREPGCPARESLLG